MRLGDHPELLAAIMDAIEAQSWAMGFAVWASDAPAGYRVTLSMGDKFLVHQRSVIVPVTTEKARHVGHAVRAIIDEMRLDLEPLGET